MTITDARNARGADTGVKQKRQSATFYGYVRNLDCTHCQQPAVTKDVKMLALGYKRISQAIQSLGPYLLIELLLPGG